MNNLRIKIPILCFVIFILDLINLFPLVRGFLILSILVYGLDFICEFAVRKCRKC